MNRNITQIYIRAISSSTCLGILQIGHRSFPCLLGKTGQTFLKREGDGKSPKGRWRLENVFLRPDRQRHFKISLNMRLLNPADGWCDAVGNGLYNRRVRLPFKPSHENLWRADSAYDLLVTTDHNQRPRKQNGGSAIFFHLIREGARFTEGCIAVKERDMKLILAALGKRSYLII